MHGSIFIREMKKEDNRRVATFILDVYVFWRWIWPHWLYGVVFVRNESPFYCVSSLFLVYFVTGNVMFAVIFVALVILGLSLVLTFQFCSYVQSHEDLASETCFETFCRSGGGGGFWLAFCCEECCSIGEGRVLGTVALVRKSDREAELFRTAVAREARGRGVASKLLEHVEDFARVVGDFEAISLWTTPPQQSGLRFYLSRGFTLVGKSWHSNRPIPMSVLALRKNIRASGG